jgi:hypothetical protein
MKHSTATLVPIFWVSPNTLTKVENIVPAATFEVVSTTSVGLCVPVTLKWIEALEKFRQSVGSNETWTGLLPHVPEFVVEG